MILAFAFEITLQALHISSEVGFSEEPQAYVAAIKPPAVNEDE